MITKSYCDGHELVFIDEPEKKRHLYVLDGEQVKGVTTANKEGYPEAITLASWKHGQAALYTIQQLKLYPEAVIKLPDYVFEELVKKSKLAWKRPAKNAANIGTLVHNYCEEYKATGVKPVFTKEQQEHPDFSKVELCLREFHKWNDESGYEQIDSEQVVGSLLYKYAGKYDSLVKHGTKVILVDYKTSTGIYAEHKIQVGGAYRQALKEWRKIEIDGIDLVRFGKDGSFEHKLITKKKDLDAFTEQFIRNLQTAEFRDMYE